MDPSQPEEEDVVTAEYDVYITPAPQGKVYMLQYPIRDKSQPYNQRRRECPTEVRIKPESGFMEVDVDINTESYYNKAAGLHWGAAMQKANAHGMATFGAAAGFGPGLAKSRGPVEAPAVNKPQMEYTIDDFKQAVSHEQVLGKQTLGGQVLHAEAGSPHYMLAAFRGNELHLTRINGIAQLRPQFHHVDALVHLKDHAERRDATENRPPPQARAALQSYKGSGEQEDARLVRERGLWQLAQEEAWSRLKYYDEDEDKAYEAYHDRLFVGQTSQAAKLTSSMDNEAYLEAISAPRVDPGGRITKQPLTRKQRNELELQETDADDDADE